MGSTGTSVKSWGIVEVAPWPFETDNCHPITASDNKSKPIIADGKEYDTGITVANAENDFERLTGNVTIGGKAVADAKVRVDANGKVTRTVTRRPKRSSSTFRPSRRTATPTATVAMMATVAISLATTRVAARSSLSTRTTRVAATRTT